MSMLALFMEDLGSGKVHTQAVFSAIISILDWFR